MFFLKEFLFRDLFFSCGQQGICLLRNDNPHFEFHGNYVITTMALSTGEKAELMRGRVVLGKGGTISSRFFLCSTTESILSRTMVSVSDTSGSKDLEKCLDWPVIFERARHKACKITTCMLLLSLQEEGLSEQVSFSSFELLAPPKNWTIDLPDAHISAGISRIETYPHPSYIDYGGLIPIARINLRANASALFVSLTSLAQGQFDKNFLMLSGNPLEHEVVTFLADIQQDGTNNGQSAERIFDELRETLRVEHLGMYYQK
jgi:hypothetical protein